MNTEFGVVAVHLVVVIVFGLVRVFQFSLPTRFSELGQCLVQLLNVCCRQLEGKYVCFPQVGFLKAGHMDVFFVELLCEGDLLLISPFCIPLQNVDVSWCWCFILVSSSYSWPNKTR